MLRKVIWHRTSLEDLRSFPSEVQDHIGFALYRAQHGDKHKDAKSLQGLSGVMEVVSRFDTNTYRTVYYAKIQDKIIVLHCFQKKAKQGISTPKHEIDVIRRRLREAQKEYDNG